MGLVSDHELIRNAIAQCYIALDSKEWSMLGNCFTADCVVDYPQPLGRLEGLVDYEKRLHTAIGHLETQHSLTTQFIDLTDTHSANVTTYCRAIHFLDDKKKIAESKFEDQLIKVSPAAWKIRERKVTVMGKPRGDWSIFN